MIDYGFHAGLALVTDVLRALEVPHMVCGSLASSRHGEPRSTHDFDLVADLGLEHATELARRLRAEFRPPDIRR